MRIQVSWLRRKIDGFIYYRTPIGEALTVLHSLYLHVRYSFKDESPGRDADRARFHLIKHCHIVEKGLSLPSPRPGFGEEKIVRLIERARDYEARFGVDDVAQMVRHTVRAYLDHHAAIGFELAESFRVLLEAHVNASASELTGGVDVITPGDLGARPFEEFANLVSTRRSVRNFGSEAVDDRLIEQVVTASIRAPSVCNRQSWAAHLYRDVSKIQELLRYQNGNAGFSEYINRLIIVTGNSKAFTRNEHNQLYVDGGLFAMTLLLGFHAAGLGSCPLNTCMPYAREAELKGAAGIPSHERLIMMIAVGTLKSRYSVAKSTRMKIHQFLKVH